MGCTVTTGRQVVKRIVVGATGLALMFALFLWTLQETESVPYRMRSELLTGWRLTVEPLRDPNGPLLSLTPPRELTMSLFQQVFERTMESMNAPPRYGIALILQREFTGVVAGLVSPDELVELAREAGIERATLEPTCLAVRRGAAPHEPRRTFYVVFNLPELERFRTRVGQQLEARGGGGNAFDPPALTPVLYLAATDGGFRGWSSAARAPDEDACVSPVTSTD